ncbi:MAG: MarR family transcriptional regulator [Lacisediminihabitans sp.]
MDESTVEEVRRLSRAAFGQRYRLELMVSIANSPDGLVSLGELSAQLGVTPSNLQKPLQSLLDTALISPTHSGDSRRIYYIRNESLAWAWALELAGRAEAFIA